MFTGLVESVGDIVRVSGRSPLRLEVSTDIAQEKIPLGASIAIDGCCLTVVAQEGNRLTFEAATETLARTTIGQLRPGSQVNLEQALLVGSRLGGHLVLGHVDGVGKVLTRENRRGAVYLGVQAPIEIRHLIAPQGSVTLAGVSLTVVAVDDAMGVFTVSLIPHTLNVTTLHALKVGSQLNIEVDVMARYVERLARPYVKGKLTAETLADKGFV